MLTEKQKLELQVLQDFEYALTPKGKLALDILLKGKEESFSKSRSLEELIDFHEKQYEFFILYI